MKLFSQLQRLMIVGATLGLLIPQPAFSGDPSSSGPIRDVALQQGGVLRGEVRSPQGRVSAGKTVSIIADGQLVAKSLTETDGRFTVSGLQPGVYAVVVGKRPERNSRLGRRHRAAGCNVGPVAGGTTVASRPRRTWGTFASMGSPDISKRALNYGWGNWRNYRIQLARR